MTRRLLTASAAAALVLGLAACGDDTGGTITDPPSTIATGASDDGGASDGGEAGGSAGGASDDGGSTEAAPDIPAPDPADYPGMDEETDEGAEQTAKYFIAVQYWARTSGDTEALKRLQTDECGACTEAVQEIDSLRENNQLWREVSIEPGSFDSETSATFDREAGHRFQVSSHQEPNGDGEPVEVDTETYIAAFGLDFEETHWVVIDYTVNESEHGL